MCLVAYLCKCMLFNNEHLLVLNSVNPTTSLGLLGILWAAEVNPRPHFELIKVMWWGVWRHVVHMCSELKDVISTYRSDDICTHPFLCACVDKRHQARIAGYNDTVRVRPPMFDMVARFIRWQ